MNQVMRKPAFCICKNKGTDHHHLYKYEVYKYKSWRQDLSGLQTPLKDWRSKRPNQLTVDGMASLLTTVTGHPLHFTFLVKKIFESKC